MNLPTSNIGKFFTYFIIQFVQYALMVANGRAYMKGLYAWTALTDALIATIGFVVVRRIAKESSDSLHGPTLFGYVSGGTLGSLFAIWLTKLLYGS